MRRQFTGRHMVVLMISFFTVIIAVNAVMAGLAATSWSGLVVQNPYAASQSFNDRIATTRARDDRGWTAALDLDGGRMRYRLRADDGMPVEAARVVASLSRPTHEGDDHQVRFHRSAPGEYRAEQPSGPGVWTVVMETTLPAGLRDVRRFRMIVDR